MSQKLPYLTRSHNRLRSHLSIWERTSSTLMCFTAPRADQGEIIMDMDIPENSPHLRGDSLRLKQILLNLLTNAIKFTPPKGKVSMSASVDASNAMKWQIMDTGVGIRANDLSRIMQPFEQVRGTVAHTHEGTGLGLYLTKSLAEAHGGTLEIESVVGKGTTVKVCFPPERTVRSP
jgi:two-component system cell cycle sensor histidine kinase PleC